MADMLDDPQYKDVIKILRGLPRIEASPGFEMELRRRIYSIEAADKQPRFLKLLTPARLIPSAALGAAAILMFFFLNIEAPQSDDPPSADPRLREDVISSDNADQQILQKLQRSGESTGLTSSISSAARNGLNFRQVNLSETEKTKLKGLKQKFNDWFRNENIKQNPSR